MSDDRCADSTRPTSEAGTSATRLVFVRHGKQISTSERNATNMQDPPLAEAGLRQAQDRALRLREGLRGVSPVLVASSPMLRALQTAAPIVDSVSTLPLVVQGSCFEYGCAGTDFRGSGLAALQQACPGATLTQLGPLGEWDYRGSSSKETEAEARQRAWRVASWLQAEGLAQARGGAVVLVAHATFLDLLLQILVDGTDNRWRYGEPRYPFGHAGARTLLTKPSAAAAAAAVEGGMAVPAGDGFSLADFAFADFATPSTP